MAAQCLQGQSLGGLRTPNAHGGPRLPRQGHMTFGKATPLNPFLCSRCSLCKTCQSPGVSQCAPGTESTVAAAPPEEQAPPGRASLTSSAAMATRQPSGLPPVRGAVLPGLDGQHDVIVAQDRRHLQDRGRGSADLLSDELVQFSVHREPKDARS